MSKLYWASAIIRDADGTPRLLAMNESKFTVEDALALIGHIKQSYTVLSAWIDVFSEHNVKRTVFHECYIDAFGQVRPVNREE